MQPNHSSKSYSTELPPPVVSKVNSTSPLLPIVDLANLLDDLDSTVDGVAIFKSDTSSPSNMTLLLADDKGLNTVIAIPNREDCRNLQESTNNITVKAFAAPGPQSSDSITTCERRDSLFDVGADTSGFPGETTARNDGDETFGFNPSTELPEMRSRHGKKQTKRRPRKSIQGIETIPVVWVIEPTYEDRNGLRFKFTTDGGTCLVLKAEEAVVGIEIMQEESRGNTYFQVYSVDGTSSRVVGPDQIARSVDEMVCDSKSIFEDEDLFLGASSPPKPQDPNRLDRRLYRFLLYRWCKIRVRRQTRIAVLGNNRSSRIPAMGRPFATLWERMTRRDDDAHSV